MFIVHPKYKVMPLSVDKTQWRDESNESNNRIKFMLNGFFITFIHVQSFMGNEMPPSFFFGKIILFYGLYVRLSALLIWAFSLLQFLKASTTQNKHNINRVIRGYCWCYRSVKVNSNSLSVAIFFLLSKLSSRQCLPTTNFIIRYILMMLALVAC